MAGSGTGELSHLCCLKRYTGCLHLCLCGHESRRWLFHLNLESCSLCDGLKRCLSEEDELFRPTAQASDSRARV